MRTRSLGSCYCSASPPPLRLSALALVGLAALAVAPAASAAVTIDWVAIGNPGNAADTLANCESASCGSVSYAYQISKYEVTNAQYTEFLNAVDPSGSNTLALYDASMDSDLSNGGIRFVSGNAAGSKYVVKSHFASKPVTYVSFEDTLRFSNWLNNGQGSGDTETGAYTLSSGTTVTRNAGASIFLPSENEWYKAAYYDGVSTSYFDYPAGSNTLTVCASPTATANRSNCEFAVGAVTAVGAYTGSGSPYGTYDQGGNVFEWTEQIEGFYWRTIRGGSWAHGAPTLAASTAYFQGGPSDESAFTGFRVASSSTDFPLVPIGDVAGPVVSALLVMTGLLGLAYRQRRHGRAA